MSKVDDFLAQSGVKGMRWGVRKRDNSPSEVTVKSTAGKRLSTLGGHNQPAHEDAVKVAVSKQKARSSTTDALSTKELKSLVERMNLEQQYSRLTPQTRSQKTTKFVSEILFGVGKQQATRVANDQATKQINRAMKKAS